eukprot:TRINITY_DN18066_c0_g1_i1.p1 TRINITY_DN18066_c0_g1~~TRINITY_DN18066_c0_g1_i1.p1  ORF type:complete len:267 (+),score=40.34 TRINITY_DN18066_c0_g1_i1:133-933(+)
MGSPMLAVLLAVFAVRTKAQDGDFEYFRCDACSAVFFKVNKTLSLRYGQRLGTVAAFEFVEVIEDICETMFTKDEFGVKKYEGKQYLFGPGVSDHIPGKGFGQMGMGDYDKRLASYCKMFIEDISEEELQKRFVKDGALNHTELCQLECNSSASGTGAISSRPRRTVQRRPTPPPREPETPRPRSRPRPRPRMPAQPPPAPPPSPLSQPLPSDTEGSAAELLEQAIGLLPRLSPLQLRWLGEAVMGELATRAGARSSAEAARRPEL